MEVVEVVRFEADLRFLKLFFDLVLDVLRFEGYRTLLVRVAN